MAVSRITFLVIFLCFGIFAVAQTKKVVGYLPTYKFDSNNSITYCMLTHLNICFANPDSNGNLQIANFNAVKNKAKAQNPDIMVCISVGGGGLNAQQLQIWANFIDIPSNRPAFISKIIDFVELNNLDGVDFDLEWDAVTKGYSDFVIELSDSLQNHNKIFTAALPATYRYTFITNEALTVFDFINIMAYDKTGPWTPSNPGQHSSFDYAKSAINFWKTQGADPSKLTLGVPFYGYNFDDKNNVYGFSYSEMVKTNIFYADIDRVGEAYYNGRPTIESKVELAAINTGGIMIWELAQDRFDEYSLLSAIHSKFNSLGYTTTGLCGNTVLVETISESGLKVYPNPATKNLYIESQLEIEINVSIFNILGERLNISPQKQFNKLVLNVSGLKEGIYILKMESPYLNQTKKIVIKGNL